MAFEPIEILITADKTGLESILKGAGYNIQDFIKTANKQEVDWSGIFTRALSTGLITSVAGTLALAVTQALQMQEAMSGLGATAGGLSAVSNGMSNVNNVVDQFGTSGASLSETSAQYTQLFENLGMTGPTATAALAGAIQLAKIQGVDLGTVVSTLIPLFQDWGINTVPQVKDAITGLANAAGKGGFQITDLATAISQANVAAQNGQSITSFALAMQDLSNYVPKQTVLDTARSAFTNAGTQDGSAILEGITKGLSSTGLVGVFNTISDLANTTFKGVSDVLAGDLGISTTDVQHLGIITATTFDAMKTDVETWLKTLEPTSGIVKKTSSDTKELGDAWSIFVSHITQNIGIPIISQITGVLDTLNKLGGSDFKKVFSDTSSDLNSNIESGNVLGGFGDAIKMALEAVFLPFAQGIGGGAKNATNNNTSTTNNNATNIKVTVDGNDSKAVKIANKISSVLNADSYGSPQGSSSLTPF